MLRRAVYPIQSRRPLRDAVLFASWKGKACTDNPLGIAEALRRRGDDREHIWVINDYSTAAPAGGRVVLSGTEEYFEALARCRYVISNDDMAPYFRKRDGQVYLQTWHGTPLKRIGFDVDRPQFASGTAYFDHLASDVARWDLLLSQNPFSTPILRRAFRFEGEICEYGYPRNDILHRGEPLVEQIRERLRIPAGKRVVLYAPTWRDNQFYANGRYRFDLRLDLERAWQVLGPDHVILVRGHHHLANDVQPGSRRDFVINVTGYPDIAELFLVSDVLITDYSSAMFDFAATGRPMLTSLYMRVGSETKTFTVTALLQLVDRKKIGLDDPIARYVQGVPDGTAITLRELADMRSGLYNYTNDPAWQEAFGRNPYRQWLPRQLLAYSFSHPLMFKPGTKFFYSNTNTILLGLVVEKVARLPLATFIKRYVLRPEHLAHTVFPPGAQFPAPHAQGYAGPSPKGPLVNVTNWNPSWGWAAGAMISTLGDLRNWARIVATGELLTPATQKQRERFLPTGIRGVRAGYGLGLFKDNGWIGHNGSLPGYQSLTIYLPSKRATVVVLVNSDINYQGSELTTLLGEAITKIITPHHVYYLPPSPQG